MLLVKFIFILYFYEDLSFLVLQLATSLNCNAALLMLISALTVKYLSTQWAKLSKV